MKTYKHIVFTRFDTHSASRFDKDWLKYRLEIFKKYTLQSLLNQDIKDFAVWIRYCEDYKDEVKEFNKYLKTLSIPFFFTYSKDGIDYETEELYDYVKDVDLVIETRIDSDDMYHKTALAEIENQEIEENKIFIFQDGYLYRELTDRLYFYEGGSGPFYICVYPKEIFINQKLKKEYFPYLPDASRSPNKKKLSDLKFVVVVHDKNDSRYTAEDVIRWGFPSGSFSKVKDYNEIRRNKKEILNEFKIWTN